MSTPSPRPYFSRPTPIVTPPFATPSFPNTSAAHAVKKGTFAPKKMAPSPTVPTSPPFVPSQHTPSASTNPATGIFYNPRTGPFGHSSSAGVNTCSPFGDVGVLPIPPTPTAPIFRKTTEAHTPPPFATTTTTAPTTTEPLPSIFVHYPYVQPSMAQPGPLPTTTTSSSAQKSGMLHGPTAAADPAPSASPASSPRPVVHIVDDDDVDGGDVLAENEIDRILAEEFSMNNNNWAAAGFQALLPPSPETTIKHRTHNAAGSSPYPSAHRGTKTPTTSSTPSNTATSSASPVSPYTLIWQDLQSRTASNISALAEQGRAWADYCGNALFGRTGDNERLSSSSQNRNATFDAYTPAASRSSSVQSNLSNNTIHHHHQLQHPTHTDRRSSRPTPAPTASSSAPIPPTQHSQGYYTTDAALAGANFSGPSCIIWVPTLIMCVLGLCLLFWSLAPTRSYIMNTQYQHTAGGINTASPVLSSSSTTDPSALPSAYKSTTAYQPSRDLLSLSAITASTTHKKSSSSIVGGNNDGGMPVPLSFYVTDLMDSLLLLSALADNQDIFVDYYRVTTKTADKWTQYRLPALDKSRLKNAICDTLTQHRIHPLLSTYHMIRDKDYSVSRIFPTNIAFFTDEHVITLVQLLHRCGFRYTDSNMLVSSIPKAARDKNTHVLDQLSPAMCHHVRQLFYYPLAQQCDRWWITAVEAVSSL